MNREDFALLKVGDQFRIKGDLEEFEVVTGIPLKNEERVQKVTAVFRDSIKFHERGYEIGSEWCSLIRRLKEEENSLS
jgi:hypothetical protein